MVELKDFLKGWKDLKTVKTFEKVLEWAEIANKFNKLLVVQGGYAVDMAAGKITRNHEDADLLVLKTDLAWFKERLEVDGYKIKIHEGHDPDLSFCAYKYNFLMEDCTYLDLEAMTREEEEMKDLFFTAEIQGIEVKYLNPKIVYEYKKKQQEAGWEKRDKEEHDFKVLDEFIK